jgi:hypothetical protein
VALIGHVVGVATDRTPGQNRQREGRASQCLLGRSHFVSLCKSSFKLILVGGFVVEGQVEMYI